MILFLLFILLLSIFLGFELISKVPSTLHTPLMSGSNAISGITLVGALTATTALGLGTQLLIIALFAAVNRPFWALYAFLGPGTVYWAGLLVARARRG